ncbi:MAG: hypothetical protein ACRDJK_07345, partial [Actinomycetota bacterium]
AVAVAWKAAHAGLLDGLLAFADLHAWSLFHETCHRARLSSSHRRAGQAMRTLAHHGSGCNYANK